MNKPVRAKPMIPKRQADPHCNRCDGEGWYMATDGIRRQEAHTCECTMTPKQQDERSRVEVTDAMVEAYLKAQRQHMEDLDNKWPRKSPHKDDVSAACHAGLTAALSAHLEAQGDVAKDSETPGTVDAMGMLNVPCKVRDGWLYIPHANGNWVTAAKLVPFSLAILANKFPDAAITTDTEVKP